MSEIYTFVKLLASKEEEVSMEPPQYNGDLLGLQKREYPCQYNLPKTKKEMFLFDFQTLFFLGLEKRNVDGRNMQFFIQPSSSAWSTIMVAIPILTKLNGSSVLRSLHPIQDWFFRPMPPEVRSADQSEALRFRVAKRR